MKKWGVMHLDENGNIDEGNSFYEFMAHNPIRFTKKALFWHSNAFPYGYAFQSYPYEESKWTKIVKKGQAL